MIKKFYLIMAVLLLFVAQSFATVVVWDPVVANSITGYKLYLSETSGAYENAVKVVPATETTVDLSTLSLDEGKVYYMVVTSYNANTESMYSNEVSYSPSLSPPLIRIE